MRAVKLCSDKILWFLTAVLANAGWSVRKWLRVRAYY